MPRSLPEERPGSEGQGPARGRKGREPNAMVFMGAGLEFAGSVVLLALLGRWLDGKWNTGPWLMLAGLAMGLVGGTYNLYRMGKRFF